MTADNEHSLDAASPKDDRAMLAALVLVPHAFSRNKFFAWFESPKHRQARRRARVLRSIISELNKHAEPRASLASQAILPSGHIELHYVVPGVEYKRTVILDADEAAIVRYCLSKSHADMARPEDSALVHRYLSKLNFLNNETLPHQ